MSEPAQQLEELLLEERAILLRRDLDALPALVEEKERLMRAVADEGGDRPTLARLGAAAARNGELIEALAKGIRAAARRIREVRETTIGLRTYSASGERQTLPTQGARFERRA